jgi:hypothetical protein
LFILQHIRQSVDNVGEHHTIDECDEKNTDSPSEEGLPQMDQMEYRRMVVEVQIMVDAIKNKHKSKSVETEGQSEDDQSRQIDIWEDSMSIALLIGEHLEVELDDIANIKRAMKWMMRYHWSKDTLFF